MVDESDDNHAVASIEPVSVDTSNLIARRDHALSLTVSLLEFVVLRKMVIHKLHDVDDDRITKPTTWFGVCDSILEFFRRTATKHSALG